MRYRYYTWFALKQMSFMSIISFIWAIIFLICIILESHEAWMDWILYRVAGHQLVELCIPLAAFLKLSSQCKDIPVKIFLQRYSSKKNPPKISLHSTCGIPVIIQQMQIYSCPQSFGNKIALTNPISACNSCNCPCFEETKSC